MAVEGSSNTNIFGATRFFFMMINKMEDMSTVTASGRIERGRLKVGDKVEVFARTEKKGEAVVEAITIYKKPMAEALSGDPVAVTLSGMQKGSVEKGDFLAEPGSIKFYTKFKARAWLLPESEGGLGEKIEAGAVLSIQVGSVNGKGILSFVREGIAWSPDEDREIVIELDKQILLDDEPKITMFEGSQVIAKGKVTGYA